MTSAASLLSLRLVTTQLREQKVFKYVLEFSDPGDWSLCFCLSSPWNPLDVLPLHTCRRRWGPDMMCGYYVLRCCVRTRSQGDKRQINHVSPPTLCFSPPQRLFFLFFFQVYAPLLSQSHRGDIFGRQQPRDAKQRVTDKVTEASGR